MLRYCYTCGQRRPDHEFAQSRHQVDSTKCRSCRNKEEQLKVNKGLDISALLRSWGRV